MFYTPTIKSTEVDKQNNELIIDLHFDENFLNEVMTLKIVQHVEVHRSGGIDKKKTVYSQSLTVDQIGNKQISIPLNKIEAYTYNGKEISMKTEVHLDKANSFFTMFSGAKRYTQLGLVSAPPYSSSATITLDPPDSFDLIKNIQVLSTENQLHFIFVSAIAAITIVANTLLGWHDQMSPEHLTYFYSHYDGDGDRQSPFFNSLIVNSALVGFFWLWMKSILRKYMSFRLVDKLNNIQPKKWYRLSNLLKGESRINLEHCELRIVACNIEHGQYETGSGKNRRTHTIKTPIKCVSLYKEKLDHIPKQQEISNYLKDSVNFDEVYADLAPPCMVSKTHGVKLHWEVQLLHPELVDQEVVGSSDGFFFGHFIFEDGKKQL